MRNPSVAKVIDEHRDAGRFFRVNGIQAFTLDAGTGLPVVCLHGVPTSSFLFRKLVRDLKQRGLRAIAFDFPGLGLTDRPPNFDYSFRGLRDFAMQAVDALGLSQFHLVVHDIGGPIGFALAALMKPRILSITILNTWVDVERFKKPLPMRPFSVRIFGKMALAAVTYETWYLAFSTMGVSSTDRIPREEAYAYVDLLKREDNGRSFLEIMRHFDYSPSYRKLCMEAVENASYPVQAVWGANDPGLTLQRYGKEVKQIIGDANFFEVEAKHLLPEDQFTAIGDKVLAVSDFA